MDNRLLEIVACPLCQGRLKYNKENQQLICTYDKVAYPISQGIPVLLADEAIAINETEKES